MLSQIIILTHKDLREEPLWGRWTWASALCRRGGERAATWGRDCWRCPQGELGREVDRTRYVIDQSPLHTRYEGVGADLVVCQAFTHVAQQAADKGNRVGRHGVVYWELEGLLRKRMLMCVNASLPARYSHTALDTTWHLHKPIFILKKTFTGTSLLVN